MVNQFVKDYWGLYKKIIAYKGNPNDEGAKKICEDFDELFSRKTGYDELDARIEKTQKKKTELLTILDFPEAEAHNNPAELAARVQKRREDVSLHTRVDEGTRSKDTMMTIVESGKKLKRGIRDYIFDRVNRFFELPSIASSILEASKKDKKEHEDSG